ncbi:hypothetical protein [Idiomarina xiamenensis]|uniref:Uncharacterized protein n=1 Tax=Idiomarina xiamenensis 10-D-4 TaxID=740709 RepID=K2KBT1_9GAMM|nr:hypothetical protein [Idiomarina xiamenensis]EKE85268.1 hypothetical protein A10D4_02950 [Idiomarina xiamenensis 10-D-4]
MSITLQEFIDTHTLKPREGLRVVTRHSETVVLRSDNEWLFYSSNAPTVCVEHLAILPADSEPEQFDDMLRWVPGKQQHQLHIKPVLPHLPVVVKPTRGIAIPGNSRAQFYTAIPMSLQLFINPAMPHSEPEPVYEMATEPLQQTWFGLNTREGEVCFASADYLRLSPELLDVAAHHVLMELRVVNKESRTLRIDKLNIPVMYLPIYQLSNQQYWSPTVTIINERHSDALKLNYARTIGRKADNPKLVGEARLKSDSRTFFRALEAIIG